MPVSWRILDGLVVFDDGDVAATRDEWRAALENALTSSDYRSDMGFVYDLRPRSRMEPATEVLQHVHFLSKEMKARAIKRWAVVAQGGAHYGMARMGETLGGGRQFRGFREMAEAEAWARGGPVE